MWCFLKRGSFSLILFHSRFFLILFNPRFFHSFQFYNHFQRALITEEKIHWNGEDAILVQRSSSSLQSSFPNYYSDFLFSPFFFIFSLLSVFHFLRQTIKQLSQRPLFLGIYKCFQISDSTNFQSKRESFSGRVRGNKRKRERERKNREKERGEIERKRKRGRKMRGAQIRQVTLIHEKGGKRCNLSKEDEKEQLLCYCLKQTGLWEEWSPWNS